MKPCSYTNTLLTIRAGERGTGEIREIERYADRQSVISSYSLYQIRALLMLMLLMLQECKRTQSHFFWRMDHDVAKQSCRTCNLSLIYSFRAAGNSRRRRSAEQLSIQRQPVKSVTRSNPSHHRDYNGRIEDVVSIGSQCR